MPKLSLLGFTINWWKEETLLILTGIFILYVYLKYKYSYWYRRGFPSLTATIPFGSLYNYVTLKQPLSANIQKLYNQSSGYDYIGYYSLWTPNLLIRDPKLIKNILVKDFDMFCDRGMYYNEKIDPLSAHLFAIDGIKWKTTRTKLNPLFSSSKVKLLFQTMKLCALELNDYIKESMNEGDVVNLKEIISKHSMNVIAKTAIGIEDFSLKKESTLFEIAAKVSEPTAIQSFRFGIAMSGKDFAKLIRMRFTPKSVETYYKHLTKEIVEYRSKNNIVRNDVMSMLMEIWNKNTDYNYILESENEESLTMRDLAAQTFVFILAAYETSASTICFALYELAYNPEIQNRLIDEVDSVKSIEDINYENVSELTYLTMVLNETWRKYPPGGILLRETHKDYVLPDGRILEKGINVTIPVKGIHNDPEYFPEPERFDPERFNKESPSQEVQPYTFLPFGEGRRNCIGKRYAIVQSAITLAFLVSQFRFELAPETQVPVEIDPKTFVTQPKGGMCLRVINRK